jgi:hypothetical protein
LGQQAEQRSLALEQAAQDSRDRKGPVTVRDGGMLNITSMEDQTSLRT